MTGGYGTGYGQRGYCAPPPMGVSRMVGGGFGGLGGGMGGRRGGPRMGGRRC